MLRFAVVGLDHGHIYSHVEGLLAEGCEFVGYCPISQTPGMLEQFQAKYPDVPQIDRDTIFADPKIDVICTAAVANQRADIAIRAMRSGKDAMIDKPGVTTRQQLADARKVHEETGKFFSICFSERLCVPSAVKAGKLIKEGAIGRVIQTIGLGPHQKHQKAGGPDRPDWFWDTPATGGILVDIGSHQIDQFLYYTGSDSAKVTISQIGNFNTPEHVEFQDFGDMQLLSDTATGYIRVDWHTPDGLGKWGDGRLVIMGTDGYIELRKYIDIAGRAGADHLFLVNGTETRHIDCSSEPLDYFREFVNDVKNRTQTALNQEHVFEVCRLSLDAQENARVIAKV
ncbi:Gfo/Idh/MocA family oxidoreductase [Paracoccus sp. S3-43]|uniref:Gfo/Idh/MocA family protein n=1 Tax=Paracoccus sp. S3-43 TaxID=3030011 RepID=UPI0023AFA797|nr:Gfo/Idh/MocA family oxidoreductase [Paracoccus sp. S3-43]WEF25160.1 Gfo/Idh/MocA family oxidoreductase [Paracoccus sp. S3-43]